VIPFQELKAVPLLAMSLVEKLLNEALALDPESQAKVARLEGKVIGLHISGLDLKFYLMPCAEGLKLHSYLEGEPDVFIKGGPVGLMRVGLSNDASALFGEGVEIEGDMDLGRKVQRIIDGLDIDWEEQLSRLMGDIAAHQVGNFLRGASQWSRNTSETFSEDVVEYLQEESRDLVVRAELDEFLDRIDVLRMDADRLEQRIQRLQSIDLKIEYVST